MGTLDSSKMARLMFLVLVLPIAKVEMSSLRGVDLKVTTVTHRPFIMPNNLSSGDRYQGLLVDMLRELSNMLGSPHREELSRGILRLQESGKMEMLAKKWIGLEGSGCAAEQEGILNWLSGIF